MLKLIDSIDLTSLPSNEAQRLFHGRGHCYPGYEHISIDWLPPVILITLYREVESTWLSQLSQQLIERIPQCQSMQAQYRCRPKAPIEPIWGESIDFVEVIEEGLKYKISLGKNQNNGLFLDMRNGHNWVRHHARDRTVLNLFAYTCAFSVAALAGGASKVVNVDLSRQALSTGRDNHRLNDQDTGKVQFEGIDIFKSFGRLIKQGPYDLLICDPPTLQRGSVNIEHDYKKIIRRIPQLMNPRSELLLCLNSPELDEQFILNTVADECPDCTYLHPIENPTVFCEAEKGKGLKVLLFRYLSSK